MYGVHLYLNNKQLLELNEKISFFECDHLCNMCITVTIVY